jgi:hypothetical protein
MFSSRWWIPVSKRSKKAQDGSGRCCTSTSDDGLFLDWFHGGKKCIRSRQSSVYQHISINQSPLASGRGSFTRLSDYSCMFNHMKIRLLAKFSHGRYDVRLTRLCRIEFFVPLRELCHNLNVQKYWQWKLILN